LNSSKENILTAFGLDRFAKGVEPARAKVVLIPDAPILLVSSLLRAVRNAELFCGALKLCAVTPAKSASTLTANRPGFGATKKKVKLG
jgi:tryptophan synthase alpha subunit